MNKSEREHLEQLVLDCCTYNLSEKESLEYVKIRLGKSISCRHYYRIKRKVSSEPFTQSWLDYHTRIGFAIEHRKRIWEIELLQRTCIQLFKNEVEKSESEQNLDSILAISNIILKNNAKLSELSLDTPIIAQIKRRLEDAQRMHSTDNERRGQIETAFS